MTIEIEATNQGFPAGHTGLGGLVGATELADALADGVEVAVLDVRPDPQAAGGHLLRAATVTVTELAQRIDELVPRRSAPIVVYGEAAGDPAVAEAIAVLDGLGYTDVSELDGGQAAWRHAGYQTYARDLALTKAFGEFVEQTRPTPGISPDELRRRLAAGDDIVVIDSRPYGEYNAATVPGAVNVPGAELLTRFDDVVPSPTTQVVVTCGGRTRAIIGAQVLIDAGVANDVVELENGTTGWVITGNELEHGATRAALAPSAAARVAGARRARDLAQRAGVTAIDEATLAGWRLDADRTLYVFDVRTAEEFEVGHLAGSTWVAGGQLVQELSRHVAVLAGRIVLVDDGDSAHAFATAAWLRQLGVRDVAVLAGWSEEHTERAEGIVAAAQQQRGNAVTGASDIAARRASSADYVAWCAAVVGEVDRDRTHSFVGLAS